MDELWLSGSTRTRIPFLPVWWTTWALWNTGVPRRVRGTLARRWLLVAVGHQIEDTDQDGGRVRGPTAGEAPTRLPPELLTTRRLDQAMKLCWRDTTPHGRVEQRIRSTGDGTPEIPWRTVRDHGLIGRNPANRPPCHLPGCFTVSHSGLHTAAGQKLMRDPPPTTKTNPRIWGVPFEAPDSCMS